MSGTINSNYQNSMTSYELKRAQVKADEAKDTGDMTADKTCTTAAAKEDSIDISDTYKTDKEKISSMKADLSNNVSAFRMMVQGMFQKQGGAANSAMNALLNIDKATQRKAQEAISENGEWGVNATTERILDFAKALTGGDPSKISAMKSAVNQGFQAAGKVWGGKLPDISQKTYDKVMEGFKAWEETSNATKAPTSTKVTEE